jgi:hypothetical protein
MARHEVNVSRSIKPAASAESDRGGSREVKEAKSKALAARNAILKRHGHREASEDDGAFVLPAPTKVGKDATVQERWMYLEAKHSGVIERLPAGHAENPSDQIVLRMSYGDGDRVTGKGKTTAEALSKLADNIDKRG